MADVTPASPLPGAERTALRSAVRDDPGMVARFGETEHDQNGFLYCRVVTCPHCEGEAPLLNSLWLSKAAKDPWAVRIEARGDQVAFAPFRAPRLTKAGEAALDAGTVTDGVGQCVHCRQAIAGDEIKVQARGESPHGAWRDRLYAVHAVRLQPKIDAKGRPQRYVSGARKGEIKTEKRTFFRAPSEADLSALDEAVRRLEAGWDAWDDAGLIPVEQFPEGNDMRPVTYGMPRWCDLFAPRQLLGHLTLMDRFLALQPRIQDELGEERARGVITYLQFVIDKFVDYNSRQTRWIPQRCSVSGTFSRHDFSLKWTYGEMPYSGPASGLRWALSQVIDAYRGIAELAASVHDAAGGEPPVTILNGSATHMPSVADGSVDLVCFDPPYYDNVQYGELSDFYYAWQRRGLRNVHPDLFRRVHVDKADEAVANPAREGSAKAAKAAYERMMGEIFAECRRVLRDDGVMTLMFTHKKQEAWETLTRALIEAGWTITACMPVESESGYSTHQMNLAAAASTIFISCRKRDTAADDEPALWRGFGGEGVEAGIREAVRDGLAEFERLRLNPVDEMIASFGRALQVLSERWPVQDGDEMVSPLRAMTAASAVVAAHQVAKITGGRLSVDDLDSETAMALTALGAFGLAEFPYDDGLNLGRALQIGFEAREGNYRVADRRIGVAKQIGGVRWSLFRGQCRGIATLGSGPRHAAALMTVGPARASSGVLPPRAECGLSASW